MTGLLTLLPMLLLAPPQGDAPDLDAEQARHQGTWAVVRSIRGGTQGPAEAMKEIVRVVEGNRVVWKRNGESFAATTFELDPSAEPKAIDLTPEGGPGRGTPVLGIYKFEDDQLIICMADAGRPRPAAFEAGPGVEATLMTFRRVEPEEPPAPGDRP